MTSINRNPPTSNERLALAMARRQIRVIRYGNRLNLEAMDILNRTQEKLAAQVLIYANRLKGVGLDTATGQLLLRAYTKQVLNVRVPAWEKIAKLFKDDITALGLEEIDYFVRLFEEVSPYELTLATPKKADATRVLLNTPFEGKTLDQWIKNSQRADIERIVTRTKVALVQEARGKLKGDARHVKVEILSRVIGTKPMHGRDGVLNKAMNNIKAISYTSVNHAQNNASHQVAKSNPFVITEEYFIATLD
ncbi:MAG: hypothetical protein GY941_20930, partial [Planctomycetes bacterium]|nr:hypothetical protein [Planctomycetota bacterium]